MERRQAQAALQRNEALLRAVCDNTPDYIMLKDREGRIMLANPAALRAVGKPATEVIGQTDVALFGDSALAATIMENDCRVMERGDIQSIEETVRTPDGIRTFISTKTPWRDGNGQVAGTVSISRDVTDQKRAQQELIQSERRERERANELEAIMDSFPLTTFISRDPECRTVLGSRRTYETLGLPLWANLSGSDPSSGPVRLRIMQAGSDVPPEKLPMQIAARTGRALDNYSCDFVLNDSAPRHMLGSAVPLLDKEGQPRGAVAAFIDVTEAKQMEQRLREAHKLESIGMLAGGIAHDFNNILTAVTGSVGLAVEELCPHCEIAPLLRTAMESAERAAGLTRQLLAYAGKGTFLKELVSVSKVGHEAIQHLRASAPNNVEIRTDFAPSLPPVMMNSGQMHQIFTSLILNAIEAIDPAKRGLVQVKTGLIGELIHIVVADNGSGMENAVKAQMFEPFFSTKFIGRGLGLAAVQGIVRDAGGTIAVETEVGRGTRVELTLPAENAVAVQNRPPEPARVPTPAPVAPGALLIVDDEPDIRKLIGALLKKWSIPRFEAATGREAIDRIREHGSSIRAVVLDVTMPEMRGDEALPAILKLQPDVQVIVCSGHSEGDINRIFARSKFRSFLPKPFTGPQLLAHVLPALGLVVPE